MKIIELRAENIKNLKVVEIRPDGAVILEGKNGAGKSAVLDSIFMVLTGRKIDEPIRNGEKRAEISVDLGTYKVKRVFTAKGDRLEVKSKEGSPLTSPQALLNEVVGKLSFDPLQFAEMGRTADGMRRQRAMLAALVGLDFTELNAERARLYDERTIKNREIKGGDPTSYRVSPGQPLPLEALVGKMEVPKPGTPRQEISFKNAVEKLNTLQEKRRIALQHVDRIHQQESEIKAAEQEIEGIDADIARLQAKKTDLETFVRGAKRAITIDTAPEVISEEAIKDAEDELATIEEKNKEIRSAIEYDQAMARLENARKDVAHLEDQMAKIDLKKENAVKAAKFPIEGLGLTDTYATYQGKPFSQLSTGEQIRVSTAVAMALNPTLKVIVVREGSLLDKEGLEAIVDLAKEKDYQLWIERVSDDKQVGIYLEDGEIKI